jgi:hypothetical protein
MSHCAHILTTELVYTTVTANFLDMMPPTGETEMRSPATTHYRVRHKQPPIYTDVVRVENLIGEYSGEDAIAKISGSGNVPQIKNANGDDVNLTPH